MRRSSSGVENPPKRTRITAEDGYPKGAVVRIKLKDFVTYCDVEVVIGPNGTGKSTLVSAMELGLAGQTKYLGRSEDLAAFIRNGCSEATIEIELAGDPTEDPIQNHVFKRVISTDAARKSKWFYNGKPIAEAQIREIIVGKLNVQVDNLCQFLPQDRVGSFTELTAPALLRETERALGGKQMVEDHDALQYRGKERDQVKLELTAMEADLEQNIQANDRIRVEIKRMEEREELTKKVKFLEKKLKWLTFEQHRQECVEMREKLKEAKEEHDAAVAKVKPLETAQKAIETAINKVQAKADEKQSQVKGLDVKRTGKASALEQSEVRRAELEAEMKGLQTRAERARKEKEKLEAEVRRLEGELEHERHAPDQTAEAEKLKSKIKEYEKDIDAANKDLSEYRQQVREKTDEVNRAKNAVRQLEDGKSRVLSVVQRLDQHAYRAHQYITQNPQRFTKPILGPICLEISPKDLGRGLDSAQLLENVISKGTLMSFVAQNETDRNTLRTIISEQKLRISYVLATPGEAEQQPPVDKAQLAKFGITHWASEIFDAHPAVRRAISAATPVHKIAIGGAQLEANGEAFFNHVRANLNSAISLAYSPNRRLQQSGSRYDANHVSLSFSPTRPAAGLLGKQDTGELKEAKEKLKAAEELIKALTRDQEKAQRQKDEKTKLCNEMRQQIKLITGGKERLRSIESKLKFARQNLDSMREEDTAVAEERIKGSVGELAESRVRLFVDTAQMGEALSQLDLIYLEKWQKSQDNLAALHQLQEAKLDRDEKERLVNAAKKEFNEARAALDKALSIATNHTSDEAKKDKKRRNAAAKYVEPEPRTMSEATALHAELKLKLDQSGRGNPHLIEQYKAREAQIKELSTQVEERRTRLEALSGDLARLEASWSATLEGYVRDLNVHFAQYFHDVDCLGEVILLKEPNYADWGIAMKAQFRDSMPLQQVSAATQSGGERAVATMVFLTSLQRMTNTPFRLVDEINQGMDKFFEKAIFEQISKEASKPGVPQYFLLTPKLLSDLPYSNSVTILCIFNGPFLPELDINAYMAGLGR